MRKSMILGLSALVLASIGTSGVAQIRKLTLEDMVNDSEYAVFGEIVSSRVYRKDHPVDGPELYFTEVMVEGRRLQDGTTLTIPVTFYGGFINEEEGVYNSEAPVADDIKVGNKIVAFYKYGNMSGGVSANALFNAHGGLYRTQEGPSGTTVMGRGTGYAVSKNIKLTDLDKAITSLHAKKIERQKQADKQQQGR